MKTKSTRLQYIDIAKGIAMICIILGHLGNASINRIVFTFHVPFFFFILKKILPQKVAHKNHIAPIPGIQNGSVYVSPAPYKAA